MTSPMMFFSLLPLAAAVACLEDDCPSRGQALLQAGNHYNLEHMSKIFSHQANKGRLALSQQDSNDLLKQVQGRAESAVFGGRKLTELERTTFSILNETLENTTIPALLKGHEDDQAELNTGIRSLGACNSNFEEDANASSLDKEDVDANQENHRYCRGNQTDLVLKHNTAMRALTIVVNESRGCGILPNLPQDVAAADSFYSTGLEWFQKKQKLYAEKKGKYISSKKTLKSKEKECDGEQRGLEVGYCQWLGRATAANKSLQRCWSQAIAEFGSAKTIALDAASQRKIVYESTRKIQCFLGALFLQKTSEAKHRLAACKTNATDTSSFNLVNTTAPKKADIAVLGNMSVGPGDRAWEILMYAGLSNVKKVTPCAPSHTCSTNERVRSHRCVACAAGKSNNAGDDAVGGDTNCSAIKCEVNEHVSSKSCSPCAAGWQNEKGDDASGSDTMCKPMLCGRGQRVRNHSCHACAAGTQNDVGGHDASGPDTSCAPIVCKQDQRVKSHACHTCPRGTTNAAGDVASGPNTTCDATKCPKNTKVVSNRCKGCPPGRFNAAGDDASGADTKCTIMKCSANQHVCTHACCACPDGTHRNAGDNAAGPDTTCTAIRCGANQRVLSNACVPCPAGHTNGAGDDASGADTSCSSCWVPGSGVQYNVRIDKLQNSGWKTWYEQPYSHSTNRGDISPTKGDWVMWGAKINSGSSVLSIAGFGRRSSVLRSSSGAWENGIYWYAKSLYSNGFASSSTLRLNTADTLSGNDRLSWHLNRRRTSGGYRAGNTMSLNSDHTWRKVVMYCR